MIDIRSYENDHLDSVQSPFMEHRLIFTYDDMEIGEMHIKSGSKISIYPEDDYSEVYHLISGELLTDGGIEIKPGKYFAAVQHTNIQIVEDSIISIVQAKPSFSDAKDRREKLHKLAVQIEERDEYTKGHCIRIRNTCLHIVNKGKVRLSAKSISNLESAAYIHDVGKVRVPLNILNKDGKLTDEEWVIMKKHPTFGTEMIKGQMDDKVAIIVEQHHEMLDGTGYPKGLKERFILTESQILTVADVYDALTTERSYKQALSHERAIYIMEKMPLNQKFVAVLKKYPPTNISHMD